MQCRPRNCLLNNIVIFQFCRKHKIHITDTRCRAHIPPSFSFFPANSIVSCPTCWTSSCRRWNCYCSSCCCSCYSCYWNWNCPRCSSTSALSSLPSSSCCLCCRSRCCCLSFPSIHNRNGGLDRRRLDATRSRILSSRTSSSSFFRPCSASFACRTSLPCGHCPTCSRCCSRYRCATSRPRRRRLRRRFGLRRRLRLRSSRENFRRNRFAAAAAGT
mmetsp:Transcript_35182/g.75073  ORF Transcript_35182/g.75073 Transcript_35182/m.75073 type:complete len:216 (-) Transcript_35182:465-1112(-)